MCLKTLRGLVRPVLQDLASELARTGHRAEIAERRDPAIRGPGRYHKEAGENRIAAHDIGRVWIHVQTLSFLEAALKVN